MWWVIALAALCFVFVMVWTAPVIIQATFSRVAGDDEGEIFVRYLYGLVRVRRSLSMLNTSMTEKGPKLHVHHEGVRNPNQKKEKIISVSDVWNFLGDLPRWVDFFHKMMPIVHRLWRKIHVRHINMQVVVGTGDAVFTGITVGLLFGIANLAFGTSSRYTSFDQTPQIEIQPNFNHPELQIQFSGIIRVRAGYAISAALRLFFVWKRRISDGAPDTGSDADRHGEHSRNGRREHDYRRSG